MTLQDDAKAAGKGWIMKHIWPLLFGLVVVVGLCLLYIVLRH